MDQNPVLQRMASSIGYLLAAVFIFATAAVVKGRVMIPPTATTALKIVSHISGVRTRPPTLAPSIRFPDGPLMGNGSLGVAVQGRNTDTMSLYLSREDFWSVLRGRIMPMGRLKLTIPALANGSYLTRENIGPADITGRFTKRGGYALAFKTWVADPEDLVILKLTNIGTQPLPMSSQLLDAWGTPGAVGMAKRMGDIQVLRVSPDTVDARIGEPSGRDPAGKFSGAIADVRIYPRATDDQRAGDVPPARFAFLTRRSHVRAPTGPSTRLNLGNLAMPQRAFTVSAWVYPTSNRGNQAIFSAMTSRKWLYFREPGPNPPEISYGFTLSLLDGHPSAMLNRVRITAPARLPLRRWSQISVSYTGRTLSIHVDHRMTASTNRFPPARDVVGPGWDWNAIHPGDKKLPFDGCSPVGVLATRIIGQDVRHSNRKAEFTLRPGASVVLAISALDDRDTPHDRAASLKLLSSLDHARLESLWKKHVNWWRQFWSRSYIKIPDKKIEAFWYGSLYLFACSSAPGHVAPGLWGNFLTAPRMGWNGDYTLDYNYEAPYWAAFPTNHVSLAENYDQPLLDWMKRGKGLARHRHFRGLLYYSHLSPLPGWSDDGAKTLRQKSDALFAAVDCIMRWRYTRDPAYARRVFPFLHGVAEFWDHYLADKAGVYVDYNDAADELTTPHDINPATSIAFLRMLYSGLLSINRALHLHDADAVVWSHILHHLSPLPIFPAAKVFGPGGMQNKLVIRYTEHGLRWLGPVIRSHWRWHHPVWPGTSGYSVGMNPTQVIFPGWDIGLESSPRLLKAARDTVHIYQIWYDYNDTNSYYAAAADIGYNPESILRHLNILIAHASYPSFVFQMGGGGVENFATVPTAICSMLLQSYQNTIILFPDWPANQNANFGNLLACGDFLISSRIERGQVVYAKVKSRRGGTLHLKNPWPHAGAVIHAGDQASTISHAKVIVIATHPGETLVLTPH